MALTILEIKNAPDGKLVDGNGLIIVKKGRGGKWIYRYSFGNKRPEMGLGTWPKVTLADARKERDRWALILNQGKNPIDERKAAKAAIIAEQSKRDPSLEELTTEILEVYKSQLRDDGKAGRWISPLRQHVFPKLGKRPISSIKSEDIRATLAPIWKDKHPTAEKALQRLHIVLSKGGFRGYECSPYIVDVAKEALGYVNHQTTHIPSTPWKDIPELYRWLEGRGASAVGLQFLMLTLVRVAAVCGARFEEFDENTWTVPKERIKGHEGKIKDFRVPLSIEAQDLIKNQRNLGGEYAFPGYKERPLSNSSMSKMLRENNIEGRPHGFRTSFRTWVQDNQTASAEVAESILGHVSGTKTEQAYARSDILELRRDAMEKWARYVTGKTDPKGEDLPG